MIWFLKNGSLTPRARNRWAPTLTFHDPDPPQTLESPAGGVVEADGLSTATATAQAVGAAVFAGVGSSTGIAAVDAAGAAIAQTTGDSTGEATGASAGAAVTLATGASTGEATSSASAATVQGSLGDSQGIAAGLALAAAIGASLGASAGEAASSGGGGSTAGGSGSSEGEGGAEGEGETLGLEPLTVEYDYWFYGAVVLPLGSTGNFSYWFHGIPVLYPPVVVEADGLAQGEATATAFGASVLGAVGASAGEAVVSGVGDVASPPVPPITVLPGGGGGYGQVLLPRRPRVYVYEMRVMAVASAGADVTHVEPTIVEIPPEIPVRLAPQVHRFSMDVALRAQARAEVSVSMAVPVRGGEGAVSVASEIRHVDWIRDVIIPDDDDVLTLL